MFVSYFVIIMSFFFRYARSKRRYKKEYDSEICGILGEKIASKSIKFLIAKAEVEKSSCSFFERFAFPQDWLCG